ncbi:hypothetical protein JCM6882_002811 [Rhodosporidiobolus microsporus]
MAKSAPPPPPSSFWAWLKLSLTLLVLAGLAYGAKLLVAAVQDGIAQGKESLEKRGVNVSREGMTVKTNKRALTQEETEDRLQRGIMKGWKSASFNVPWLLSKTTHLSGSVHDKQKEAWEKENGPKKHKSRVE